MENKEVNPNNTHLPFNRIDTIFEIITSFLEATKENIAEKVNELRNKYRKDNNM